MTLVTVLLAVGAAFFMSHFLTSERDGSRKIPVNNADTKVQTVGLKEPPVAFVCQTQVCLRSINVIKHIIYF